MTLLNDNGVLATANIYEKDLDKVKSGQRVQVKVASLPNQTFEGQITFIGAAVEGETRVVPVKAKLDNSSGLLKPGMFAELEVLTNRTPKAILVIPSSAMVEANGKQLVYVRNGAAFEAVEVTLGQTAGESVEVKSGLFEGDSVVTQGAMQFYAQSLRGGNKMPEAHDNAPAPSQANDSSKSNSGLPLWLVIPAGAAIAASAFWIGRSTKPQTTLASAELAYVVKDSPNGSQNAIHPVSTPASRVGVVSPDESPQWVENHHKLH